MTSELYTAIQEAWAASSTLVSAFAGGLEVGMAADAEALPNAVLVPVSAVPDYETETLPYLERVLIQVTLRARKDAGGGDFLLTAADALNAVFNNRNTTVMANDSILCSRRVSTRGPVAEDEQVVRLDVDYRFWLQRNA